MKVVVIIQARMGSARFRGKSMTPLNGKPLLWHVLDRAKRIKRADAVVLAIPHTQEDDCLERLGVENGVKVHRGSSTDVLARYYSAAKEAGADWIVRITGDCPLIGPNECDAIIVKALESGADYTSNIWPERTVPSGLDCEVFKFSILEEANDKAVAQYDREHVTPWMQNTLFFRKYGPKISVDTPEDLDLVGALMRLENR